MAKEKWHEDWNGKTDTARTLRHLTRQRCVKTGPKLYNTISNRNTVATITQLRTGHCGLNYYLHRFGKSYSPYCECGKGKETLEHYLLECRRYHEERIKLRKQIGKGRLTLGKLLREPQAIKHTIEYVKATKRLQT